MIAEQEPPAAPPRALLALALALVTVATFLPALACGFVYWDDPQSVPEYGIVLRGLSWEGAKWAFTHGYFAHWLPLTVMSHMVDWQLFGADPRGHHLTSLLLHAGSVLLVFALWDAATGRRWRAAAVAALWAIHPLRVEPVVWVAARKDMLSGFFGLLALVLYVRWARDPRPVGEKRGRYAAIVVAFLLGLLSKPMVVSLPVMMLLLDFWPLGRLRLPAGRDLRSRTSTFLASAWPLVREKLPFVALAVADAVGALVSQRRGGAMAELGPLPLSVRLGNAFISYASYLWKTLWPHDLAAFYKFPSPPAGWREVLPCVALVMALTALALGVVRRWPWVTVGWLWFVVSLVPVIGLVQVGDQAMADRYTYLPEVGLFAAVAWSAAEALATARARKALLVGSLTAALAACAVGTRMQIRWWKDTPSLYRHMLTVDEDNHVAHLNLANWLTSQGQAAEAVPHFRRAIELRPNLPLSYANLGNALRQLHDYSGAERELARAIQMSPNLPAAHLAMAMVDDDLGKPGPAAGHLAKVIAVTPQDRRAWEGLAAILRKPGAARQALPFVAAVARAEPRSRELRELVEVLRRQAAATPAPASAPAPRAPGPPSP